jgi:hypothetical protein
MDASTTPTLSDLTPAAQGPKVYAGGCHCGAVRFEAEMDLTAGTGKCNCSICCKTNFWGAIVKPDKFRLLQGDDSLTNYQFNSKVMQHPFCKHCGIRSFGRGDIPQVGGAYISVNVNCLDEHIDPESVPVRWFDGRHNNWMGTAPARP